MLLFLIISFLFATLFSVVTQSVSVFIFYLFFIILGYFLIRIAGKKQIRKTSNYIFGLFYLTYTLFAFGVFLYKIHYNLEYVRASDQLFFYNLAERLGENPDFSSIINYGFLQMLNHGSGGYTILTGAISFIANHFIDGNQLLLHLFTISFFSSFSIVVLFRILVNYFSKQKAKKYALLFGFFSYLFYYSGFMLRDAVIAFLFMQAIYLLHNTKFTYSVLFRLIILAFLTFSFRYEDGLFMLLFIGLYLWKTDTNYKKRIAQLTLIIIMITSVTLVRSTFNQISFKREQRQEYFSSKLSENKSGLAAELYKLPPILKEVSVSAFVLINPFPFWAIFSGKAGDVIFLNYSLAGIFWYFVNGFILFALIFKSKKLKIETWIKIVLITAYSFILLNAFYEIQLRRIMAIYPLIYISFLYLYNKTSIKLRKQITGFLSVGYFILSFTYLLFKF